MPDVTTETTSLEQPTKHDPEVESAKLCRFCNNFEIGYTEDKIPFDDWVPAICASTCPYCIILVRAIRKLEPRFFSGAWQKKPAGPRPNEYVGVSISERCRVIILVSKDGWGHREVDLQFFHLPESTVP